MAEIEIQPLDSVPTAVVRLPGSAAVACRALVAVALARGRSRLANAPLDDDVLAVIDVLRSLGIRVEIDEPAGRIIVHGVGGHLPAPTADVHCADSETAVWIGLVLCALGRGRYRLDGGECVRGCSVESFAEALGALGVQARYEIAPGYLPIEVIGRGLGGGSVAFAADASDTCIDALLLVAPCARSDVFVTRAGPANVDLTTSVMDAFGVAVIDDKSNRLVVPAPQMYQLAG